MGKTRTVAEKKEVLEKIGNLSKKECERTLFAISPETLPREKERVVSPELTELKLVLDQETMKMIEQLKDAHAQVTTSELIKRALSEMLKRTNDARAPKFAPVKTNSDEKAGSEESSATGRSRIEIQRSSQKKTPPAISFAEMRRQVFAKARNRCEFVSGEGKRCASTHDLELDHRTPRARGGKDTLDNLRCLCRAHNAFEAVRILGQQAMENYLPHLRK